MGRISTIILLITLTGCSSMTKPIEIQTVKVPVIQCPAPPLINRPELPINTITSVDSAGDIVVKYKATIRSLLDYSVELEQIIDTYKGSSHD